MKHRFFAVLMILSIGVASAAPLNLYVTPYKVEEKKNIFRPAPVSVVCFFASWCPPCERSMHLVVNLKKRYPSTAVHIFFLDSLQSIVSASPFGVNKKLPLILVADHSGWVVKRFESTPDPENFYSLIHRLHEGRLENGTPPISERLDLWTNKREGM